MPNETEIQNRTHAAEQLVQDFGLETDAEFFSDPSHRVEFLTSLDGAEFFDLAQHINARMRGFEPRDRQTHGEKGGVLPMLPTPTGDEKAQAFQEGFSAIKTYLETSDDSPEEKVKGAGMATEALVIWVHPFNDGNGRTSRFLGKFIEDGTTDTEALVASAASNDVRKRVYDETLRVDKANVMGGDDVFMSDESAQALESTKMPVAEGIAKSITLLLEDKSRQSYVEEKTAKAEARAAHIRRLIESRQAA